MMLKMSFFNECLASLTLQESNALYAYTRCLEYYTRVQDYCLSLFTKVFNAWSRITNRSKIETTRKCVRSYPSSTSKSSNTACSSKTPKAFLRHSGRLPDAFMPCPLFSPKTTYPLMYCGIHAQSSLFSFWKALQYQFLIDTYEKEVLAHAVAQEVETLRAISISICYCRELLSKPSAFPARSLRFIARKDTLFGANVAIRAASSHLAVSLLAVFVLGNLRRVRRNASKQDQLPRSVSQRVGKLPYPRYLR